MKNHLEQGVQSSCFEVRLESGRGQRTHEICVNPTSREILTDDWDEPPDQHGRHEFSDYAEFRGHRSPRQMKLFVNGSKVVDLHVLTLETAALDDSLLTAPFGAIERRMCAGIKHPVPVKTPDPLYPKSSSQNGMMGDTAVSMTVLTDGSVDNIQLVGSSTRAMDEATLQTLKSWRFKPAMCGTEAVVSDIEVVVSFRLR